MMILNSGLLFLGHPV